MSELFKLHGTITVDNTDANAAIDETMAKTEQLQNTLSTSTNTSGSKQTSTTATKQTSTTASKQTSTSSSKTDKHEDYTAAEVAAGNAISEFITGGVEFFTKNLFGGVETLLSKESAIASLSAFLGDKKAANFYEELRALSLESTLGLDVLLNNAKTLLAQNMNAEEVLDTLRRFGDISMGNSERANSLLWNYAQILARGKMDAQEEKDFAKQGLSIPSILAAQTGLPVTHWREQMSSETGLQADLVTQAIKYATDEGGKFYGQMENIMGSTYGQMEKFKTRWQLLWAGIADPTTDILGNVVLPAGNAVLETAIENEQATNFAIGGLGMAFSNWLKTASFNTGGGLLGKVLELFGSNAFSNLLGAVSGFNMLYSIYDYGVEAREETARQRWERHAGFAEAAEDVENMDAGRNPVFMPTIQRLARIAGEYWENEDFNTMEDEAAVIQKLFGYDDGRTGYDPEKILQTNAALRTFGFEGNPFTGENMDLIDTEMWLDSIGNFLQQLTAPPNAVQADQIGRLEGKMDTMNSLLSTIAANSNRPMMLDTGIMVGALAGGINTALGNIVNQNERG